MGIWLVTSGGAGRRRRWLVAVLMVSVSAGGLWAAGGSGAAPVGAASDEAGPPDPAYSGLVPLEGDGRAAADLVLVDEADPGSADDDDVVLVSTDGTEHGRGRREGWQPVHLDLGADFQTTEAGVRLTEAPAVDGRVAGCGTVHGGAGVRAAVCGPDHNEIRLVDVYGEQEILTGAPEAEGTWRYAMPSPDGGWLLAQWSGGCGPGQAYLVERSGNAAPVAVLGPGSLAIGWSADRRAIVSTGGESVCPGAAEPGTYLVDPHPFDAQRIHKLPALTRLTGFEEWRANRLERVMSRALHERQLVECCGQPSHGGGDAESGMVFDGHDVQVWAVPLDELSEDPDWGEPLDFTCGTDRYFLFDGGPAGSGYEGPPDWALLQRAAQMLAPVLYCTMGGDRAGPPMDEDLLLAYEHRGSVWAVGRSGARHRLTQGPGDSSPVVGPDGAVVFGRLNYDGVFDDLVELDPVTRDRRLLGVAGVAAFSADGRLAVAEPVDDDLADTAIVVFSGSRQTARIPLGPQREVGSVSGLAWDVDNRSLLVAVSRRAGDTLWHVDTSKRSAQPVAVDPDHARTRWSIAPAPVTGRFAAIRDDGDGVVWGELSVSSGTAEFENWGVLPSLAADNPGPDRSGAAYLAPVGAVQARRHDDGTFSFEAGSEDAWLVGHAEKLYLVDRTGYVTHLLSGVAAASAPPVRR